ncbi:gamma-glutamyl-gamma-aminobutyrate hydrolase family protein [Gordonia sp. TBRC 11910]|uniref:Gamma-glutamyl-gamma-aminobutyrate hydrolase family protein n=1 Tax=Gordonia asplenii TaxID=2725283 RepID=A0A848KQC1_9ACTN|nr:gamma-glutamyl-gamma-aminobutyrate hydrolase family protein [Gordonia asplenii]NMO00886.1 gamma-glutamyl-gamma-aminobutyrate hydrolase family protein [Gordonia asplenii]
MPKTTIPGLRFSGVAAAEAVLAAVRRAGGEPVILPPSGKAWSHDRLRAAFAAVILPGGDDIDPNRYGAEPEDATAQYNRHHDHADLSLARSVVAAGIPCLAICRGLQILNVALGGTLAQDLDHSSVHHRNGRHDVLLTPTSRVAQVMGTDHLTVSSFHHQSIDRLAPGLTVTGRAPDGVIEAIAHDGAPIHAVQWHPEDDAETHPEQQALFDALLCLPTPTSRSEVMA